MAVIGPSGVRINNRTYDARELGQHRREHSGAGPDGKLWEVHYDPYDISCVWVRNHRGTDWITATWRHLHTAPVPMGELVFDRAHQVLSERDQRKPDEEAVALAAAELLDRASEGPEEKPATRQKGKGRSERRDRKVAARTRATTRPAWPRPAPEPDYEPPPVGATDDGDDLADVVPLEIFDARKEAETWW